MRALRLCLPTADDTQELGVALAGLLEAGDVLVLAGDLGAGKTTFTQGLGAGLGVRGPVTSPTFVIARSYPPLPGGAGLPLIHVDAYRLGGSVELDDLDLDADVSEGVTVVEWGSGLAEPLSAHRVEIDLTVDPTRELRSAVVRVALPATRAEAVESLLVARGGMPC